MSLDGALSISPLRLTRPPPWLTPWLRNDFEYGAVQHVYVLGEPYHGGSSSRALSLVSLVAELAPRDGVWYRVGWRGGAARETRRTVAPISEQTAVAELAAADSAEGWLAIIVVAASDLTPAPVAELVGHACVLLLVRGTSDAIIGAPALLERAREAGGHVWSEDAVDPPAEGSVRNPEPRNRSRLLRAVATVGVVAAAVGFVLTRTERAPPGRPHTSPTSPPAQGLILPDPSRGPGGRTGASTVFDSLNGYVVLYGGGPLGSSAQPGWTPRDTWTWNAAGWTRRVTGSAPPPGFDAAFAFDEDRGSALLFGGVGSDGSTWQWDGLDWQRLDPPGHPAANVFAAAAFDQRLGTVVLVALCCQDSRPRQRSALQTWEWRGGTWQRVAGHDPPTLSRAPLITYDPSDGEILLLTAGPGPVSNVSDQITSTTTLWHFDGRSWAQFSTPTSPPFDPIRDRLGYDPASRQVVLFQGGDLPTWTWNGSAWHALLAGGPRYSGALAADSTVGKILLFGGPVLSDDLSEVWTLDSGRWRRLAGR
jgi:hypothetical protein